MSSDLQRITSIGDSVFAVSLTLLAVGVRLPPDLFGRSLQFQDLRPLLYEMGAVALSFCVVSVFWLGHWVYLRAAVRATVPFLVSNLAVLLCITLIPISTRIWSAGPISTLSAAIYSANLLATSCCEMIFRRLAVPMAYPAETKVPRLSPLKTLPAFLGMGVHGSALIAAFINPEVSVYLWCSAFLIPGIQVWTHTKNRISSAQN